MSTSTCKKTWVADGLYKAATFHSLKTPMLLCVSIHCLWISVPRHLRHLVTGYNIEQHVYVQLCVTWKTGLWMTPVMCASHLFLIEKKPKLLWCNCSPVWSQARAAQPPPGRCYSNIGVSSRKVTGQRSPGSLPWSITQWCSWPEQAGIFQTINISERL